jgi:hypothetical protein
MIAGRGVGSHSIGHVLQDGTMIGICRRLVTYTPQSANPDEPLTSYVRKLEEINETLWGEGTAHIAALFLSRISAYACLSAERHLPCDSRWLASTEQVLDEIGEDHPAVEVCRYPGLALIAP